MKAIALPLLAALAALAVPDAPARAQTPASLFRPALAFGMSAEEAQAALGTPLFYVRGRPGNELLVAQMQPGFLSSQLNGARVSLQFRQGRLTGWKWDFPHQRLF